MPISYQYTRQGDTEATPLDTVDKELCELTGEPYDKKYVCPTMDCISWTGIAVLMWASRTGYKSGAYTCTWDMVIAYLDTYDGADKTNVPVPLLLRYLCSRYTFSSWR